jgi:GNAT superfamily N-acetyltransferase
MPTVRPHTAADRADFGTWLGQRFDPGDSGEQFVLEDAGRVVACGGVWLDPEKGEYAAGLSWGMVARGVHRQGYGSRLLAVRLARLRALGAAEVQLDTSQHSAPYLCPPWLPRGSARSGRVRTGHGPGGHAGATGKPSILAA